MKKKVMFHLNNLTFRGTTTAIIDYAIYNQSLLGNESIISYPKSLLQENNEINSVKRKEISTFFRDNFDTIEYDNKKSLKEELDKRDCGLVYYLKAGGIDNDFLEGKTNLIHCVFKNFQPHGHKYAYISEWLRDVSAPRSFDFVPHIVNLPEQLKVDIRSKLNIPKDKIVIGRHGGFHEFDIHFARQVVEYIINTDDSFIFVFLNTEPFIQHPNIIYLDCIFDPQDKTDYILCCDIMLQARSLGESFGLAICEGLFHNKPVLSFGGGSDKNNVLLTQNYGLIYNEPNELYNKLMELKYEKNKFDYKQIVTQFSPENVMERFDRVFLQ